MKKLLIIALALSSLSINSKPCLEKNLHNLLQKLAHHINEANSVYAELMDLVDKQLLPDQQPLNEIEQVDIESFVRLSADAKHEALGKKWEEVQTFHVQLENYRNLLSARIDQN